MSTLIAFCGIDCGECQAYKATQANDRDWMERILAEWRVQYSSPDMNINAVICDGCTSSGRHGGYCPECPIRACAVERNVVNCAHCADYACENLNGFFAMAPQAKEGLEAIRNSLSGA